MGFPRNPFSNFLPFFFFISTIFNLTPHSQSATDYTSLVYKGCAKQALSDPTNAYSQAISSLFGTLISQSSKSKFFKTTSGTSQTATITGLFQCRGDLSNFDCYNCVSKLPILINKFCGKVIAARIQLLGCYMLYEGAGFANISGMQMLYKSCSGANANGAGFEEKRDTALNSLENGMSSSGGFFATSFGGVYVLGQCEGDVGASDCVECVKNGVQRAQVECGSSIGGQIYLHKCFIGYSFYPNGVPKRSSSPGPGPDTGKTVAIILGGAVGVGFFVICLLFARNLLKKKDDY